MGDPEALASALIKIEKIQKNSVRRLLWPMIPRIPQSSWLRTHPPTKERVRRLLKIRDYEQLNHPYSYGVRAIQYQTPAYRALVDMP
jgi:Zn-dependent protease with chaperone function